MDITPLALPNLQSERKGGYWENKKSIPLGDHAEWWVCKDMGLWV